MAGNPRGTKEGEPYLSYLLRLWRVSDGEAPVWRASLKCAHSGEWLGFAGLEEMFAYLRGETKEFGIRASGLAQRIPKSERGGDDANSVDHEEADR